MDFTLDTEQRALRDAVREMCARLLVTDPIGDPPFEPDHWQALVDLGVVLADGIGPIEEMVVAEELGRARVHVPYAETVLVGSLLDDADLRARVATGTALVVPALAEPNRSWRSASVVEVGDGTLTGVKDPVSFAGAATHAMVRAAGRQFLVESPPVRGSGFAFDATPAVGLAADDSAFGGALDRATLAHCAEALGAMTAALDLTLDYLRTRKQFGVPLMTFQALTHRAVDCYVQVELARSAVRYAAMTLAEDPTASDVVTRTRVVVGKAARLVGQEAIQLHGGIGMTAEYAVGHLAARLTALEQTWGNTRDHLSGLAAGVASYDAVGVL